MWPRLRAFSERANWGQVRHWSNRIGNLLSCNLNRARASSCWCVLCAQSHRPGRSGQVRCITRPKSASATMRLTPGRVTRQLGLFLESIFQDPCPTLNGTRRATMPQVLTRRRESSHPSSQARSPAPTNPKTGSGSDHPGGRSPQSHCSISPSVLSLSPTARSQCSASVAAWATSNIDGI